MYGPMEIHHLSEVDRETKTAICSVCGPVKIKLKSNGGRACWNKVYEGVKRYRAKSEAYRTNKAKLRKLYKEETGYKPRDSYRKHVKMVCESCGYKAPHPSLMDGHHKDGNRKNNDGPNIASLCPICHRIAHMEEGLRKELGLLGRREPVLELPKPILIESFEDEKLKVEVALLRNKVKEYEVMLNGS